MERPVDWRAYLNRLSFCYGCGRFAMPPKGSKLPRGWKLLYQPHPDSPPGLPTCSEGCLGRVQVAMRTGPVHMPLETATDILMDARAREAMLAEVMAHAFKEEGLDRAFEEALDGEPAND